MTDLNITAGYELQASELDQLIARLDALEEAQAAAAASAEDLGRAQGATRTASDRAARATDASRQKHEQLTDALSAQIQGWGALGGAMGQAGAVLGRIDPEFGRFGAVVGQAGQSVSALATALAAPTPGSVATALVSVASTVVDGVAAWIDYRDAMDETRRSAMEAVQTITEVARAMRDAREAVEAASEATDLDFAAAEVAARRLELAQAEVEVNRLRAEGSSDEFRAAEAHRQVMQSALDRALTQQREVSAELEHQNALVASQSAEARDLARLRAEQAQTIAEQNALLEEQEGRRRGHGPSLWDRENEAWDRYNRAVQSGLQRQRDLARDLQAEQTAEADKALADELARRAELADKEANRVREEIEGIERAHRLRMEAIDKQKQASAAAVVECCEQAAEIISSVEVVRQAFQQAFEDAISGQKSLDEALLAATKQVLAAFGEELVAKGIGKILEGITEIPSPTAATKIGGGTAMVAFGVGLGAVSAAIPSGAGAATAKPAEPRPEADGGGGGPTSLTINVNDPIRAAGTHAQLARGLGRQLRADRTFSASLERRR